MNTAAIKAPAARSQPQQAKPPASHYLAWHSAWLEADIRVGFECDGDHGDYSTDISEVWHGGWDCATHLDGPAILALHKELCDVIDRGPRRRWS